ncbi:MAG: cytochrome c-type biogenesis protein CcmH [Anaerolineales bacterium]|nr:cytochrome c-type biogenesis protein CcmH [Anaerolineales bacterium]
MKKYLRAITLSLILTTLFTGFVFAQDDTPTDNEVNKVAHQLYCPVCENTPLDVCPTEACRDWRELIRTMLAEGKTEDEILQHFVDQYGDRVLAQPPRTGLNWVIYIAPPLIILFGAIILFRSLKEWTKPKVATPASGEVRSEASAKRDDYVARLEEEVKKRK